jgi:hypothetical protein
MPAYAYPITIDRRFKKINFDEIREFDSDLLTLEDLQFCGDDPFSISKKDWRDGGGYILNVSRTRKETEEERSIRIARAE